MNIFVLDEIPEVAARKVPIAVASKMALEAAQMLAVACKVHGMSMPHKKDGTEYSGKAHPHHPSTKWVCLAGANMVWTCLYARELCARHAAHYHKMPAHITAIREVYWQVNNYRWQLHTPFVWAANIPMPVDNDIIASYNEYVKTKPYYTQEV